MTELTQQLIAGSKLLTCVVASQLYALGGMYGTWIRRYIMPIVWTILAVAIMFWQGTFDWWKLVFGVILCGIMHFGYGASTFQEKVVKRLLYGFLLAMAALPLAILTSHYLLFKLHAALCITGSLALGVFNPVSARDEESIYGLMAVLFPTFMI